MSQPKTSDFINVRLGKIHTPTPEDFTHMPPIWHISTAVQRQIGVLVIHGFTSSPSSMYRINQTLIQQGYCVACPMLPGHGTTYKDLASATATDWFNAVLQSYQQLQKHCEHIVVIGQSLGGALALQLAYQQPEIDRLIILSPAIEAPKLLQISCRLRGLLQLLHITHIKAAGGDIKNKRAYETCYRKIPVPIYAELLDCFHQAKALVPQIKVPTTIFASHKDHVVSAKGIEAAYHALGTSDKELYWCDNSYHVLSRDNDLEQIIDYILGYLKTLEQTRSTSSQEPAQEDRA